MAATLPASAPAAGLADAYPVAERSDQRRRRLRIVVAASLLGTTVEWYDFFLYATAAGLVFNKVFFPNESSLVGTLLAFATFAVGFVMRPIGGVVFGHIGDRIGRKRSLALTMLIMGGATALIGLLPTATQIGAWAPVLLLVLRVLQGFALGGEWGGAVLLAVEHSPDDRRGRYGAVPQVGLALGLAMGTGIFAFLQIVLGPNRFLAYGWRIGFLLSLLLVVIGIVVRLRVDETPAFRELQDLQAASTVPLRDIVREPRSRRNTLLGLLSRWAEGSAFNTWGVFAISYATGALGLNRVSVLVAVTIAALLMAVLLPISGRLTERFGARRVYLVGIACYGLTAFPPSPCSAPEAAVVRPGDDHRLRRRARAVLRGAGHAVLRAVSHEHPLHRAVVRLPGLGNLRLRGHPDDPDRADRRPRRCALAGLRVFGCDSGH